MIVNPQLFNYRIIIGSLIVAIAVLAVFSFSNYESIKSHQKFLQEEKQFVEDELSEMIDRYDDVTINNELINTKLQEAKYATKVALDSLRILQSDLGVISKFKQQLVLLKEKNKVLFETVDSLNVINQNLEKDKLLAYNELREQQHANNSLQKENDNLNKSIEKGSLMTANSFKAKAFQEVKGKIYETKRAQRAHAIEVCFTLAENALTEKGEKELYIQIVNPKNNVVADKGSIEFGDSQLIYSAKIVVDYDNHVEDICTQIMADNDEKPLTKGNYYVTVFHKDRRLGSTEIVLD